MPPWRSLIAILLLLLGACTMRSAIDALTSEEDRAFAQEMVARLRSGDEAWLQQHFDAELWAQSGKQLSSVPGLFPSDSGTTQLVGFNISTNMTNGRTERNKEFRLVTEGGGRWTLTTFRTHSTGGPDRVVQWSVVPHSEPPPELAMMKGWDRAVPWIWGILLAALAGLVALIVWLVRRSRRKRDPLMGQGTGAP